MYTRKWWLFNNQWSDPLWPLPWTPVGSAANQRTELWCAATCFSTLASCLQWLRLTQPGWRHNSTWLLYFTSLSWLVTMPEKHCSYYGHSISRPAFRCHILSISRTLSQLEVCKKRIKSCCQVHWQLSRDRITTHHHGCVSSIKHLTI